MARDFTRASTQYLATSGTPVDTWPLSLSCWAYIRSQPATPHDALASILNTANGEMYASLLALSSTFGQKLRFQINNKIAVTSTSWPLNTWFHALGTWTTNTSSAVYLNGGGKGTYTAAAIGAIASGNQVSAGSSSTGVATFARSHYPDAMIAEVGIWNAALTDEDALRLAQGFAPPLVRPTSLVGYWPLIGRTSPEIDPRGGRSMTLNNAPPVADHPRIIYPAAAL